MEVTRAPFQQILVPIDGSETSLNAARLAIRVAQTHQANLCFLYVVDTRSTAEIARFSGRADEDLQAEFKIQGQRYLNYALNLAAAAGQTAAVTLRIGIPQQEITAEARERGVDLIVIGRVGQRGPRRVMIGSVAERVIEYAPCPVLVVQG